MTQQGVWGKGHIELKLFNGTMTLREMNAGGVHIHARTRDSKMIMADIVITAGEAHLLKQALVAIDEQWWRDADGHRT